MRSHRHPQVAAPARNSAAPARLLLFAAFLSLCACGRAADRGAPPAPSSAALPTGSAPSQAPSPASSSAAEPGAAAAAPSPGASLAAEGGATGATPFPAPPKDHVTLLAAGDACFGRLLGQEILKNPSFDPFESSARLFQTADIRFVNLESQLSDQKGETQSPTQKLVFTGPPGGADALARGHVDIVSAANNHMWDYGKPAFLETLDNLERAGVKYAGAGRTRDKAYAPEIVESGGLRVAFVAFTGIWNQGELRFHEAKDHVAEASREAVTQGVKAARARADVDFVVVSYHGGEEYVSAPLQLAIDLHHAAIDAGADAVIGHHPHVAQGIEIYRGKPIFYSLGNYLMRIHGTHLETEIGFFARIAFSKGAAPRASVCPFRVAGVVPRPVLLGDDPRRDLYERMFRQRLRVVQGSLVAPAYIGPTGEDGCASAETPKHRDRG
jgi:poly-gamma-glutamate synthesis protein (capsule biosynthesis protein)